MLISLIATTIKRLGAVCLVFVIVWHVARHIDPRQGKAIVHAPRPGVLVSIDHLTFPVSTTAESPVVCSLDPGYHFVKVVWDGVILGEQRFTVEPGGEVVLGPFDRPVATRVAHVRKAGPVHE